MPSEARLAALVELGRMSPGVCCVRANLKDIPYTDVYSTNMRYKKYVYQLQPTLLLKSENAQQGATD